jgi:hypothetical protein
MSHLKSTSVGPLSRFFVITEEDQGRLIFGRAFADTRNMWKDELERPYKGAYTNHRLY